MKKIIFLICTIFTLVSCAMLNQNTSSNNPIEEPVSQQLSNLTFEDLPVPSKMKLDRENSFVYETSNYRTGILFYSGKMSAVDVANFYKSEMQKYNWTLVNSLEYKKGSQLIFEKPGWIVVIKIKSNWENSSNLIITIGPKNSQDQVK